VNLVKLQRMTSIFRDFDSEFVLRARGFFLSGVIKCASVQDNRFVTYVVISPFKVRMRF